MTTIIPTTTRVSQYNKIYQNPFLQLFRGQKIKLKKYIVLFTTHLIIFFMWARHRYERKLTIFHKRVQPPSGPQTIDNMLNF